MYKKIFKRILDILISFGLITLMFPILFVVVIVLLISQGSAFFIQTRPGKNEQLFKIRKLKTMNDKKDKEGNLLPDEQRITAIGNFLRKTSLDEFPQLWNVLTGDMSIIGPRPLLVSYLELYSKEQAKRHLVRPGITGWAQVNGRNSISWDQKFKLDVWYVENISFTTDFKILWLTFLKVVKRDGISSDTSATMEVFTGSK